MLGCTTRRWGLRCQIPIAETAVVSAWIVKPATVMLFEDSINKTLLNRVPAPVAGCSSVAPGRPCRVRFSKPITRTYSVHVPFTDTVKGVRLSNWDNARLSDWPRLHSTVIGIDGVEVSATAREATKTNNVKIPRLLLFIESPLRASR